MAVNYLIYFRELQMHLIRQVPEHPHPPVLCKHGGANSRSIGLAANVAAK